MTRTVVRTADLTKDRQELIAFLHENLTPESNAARFEWLYLRGTFGEARAWMAVDSDSGRTIGAAAAFPRRFWSDNEKKRVWVLGDFCISKEARSLGPALQLQRSSLAELQDAPWYDFPSQSMTAIYKRLGAFEFEQHVRYAKLLRIDRKVNDLVPIQSIGSALSFAGNALLRMRSRTPSTEGLELCLWEGPFTAEFDDFGPPIARDQVQGVRTADFLNWRYGQHPFQKFVVVVAKRQSVLQGYTVLSLQEGNGSICELSALEEDVTLPALLAYAEHILLQYGAHTISAPINSGSRFRKYLQSAGFHARESGPLIFHGAQAQPQEWLIQPGDRDS